MRVSVLWLWEGNSYSSSIGVQSGRRERVSNFVSTNKEGEDKQVNVSVRVRVERC